MHGHDVGDLSTKLITYFIYVCFNSYSNNLDTWSVALLYDL